MTSSSITNVDIFRDTWVRYLGYANEVGEAFGPVFPKYVRPSYGVAFGYVFADTIDKVYKAKYTQHASSSSALLQGLDCLCWQTLASVLIPGKVIHFIVHGSQGVMKSVGTQKFPAAAVKWGPTMFGLAMIPMIIHPIDNGVDYLFDNTVRQMHWWQAPSTKVAHHPHQPVL